MDSFTCGTCKLTFHKLESFAEHKQSHGFQKATGIRGYESESEALLGPVEVDTVFPQSTCEASLSLFLNHVPRTLPLVLHTEPVMSVPSPQVQDLPVSSRVNLTETSCSSNGVPAPAVKVPHRDTTKFMESKGKVLPEYAKSSCSSTLSKPIPSSTEDRDVILIEISEIEGDCDLDARVYRPNKVSSLVSPADSVMNVKLESMASTEGKNDEKGEQVSSTTHEVIPGYYQTSPLTTSTGLFFVTSDADGKALQTFITVTAKEEKDASEGKDKIQRADILYGDFGQSSSANDHDSPDIGSEFHPGKLYVAQSCDMDSTIYASSGSEVENRLAHGSSQNVPSPSLSASNGTITRAPTKVTYVTSIEPDHISFGQGKMSEIRSSTISESYINKLNGEFNNVSPESHSTKHCGLESRVKDIGSKSIQESSGRTHDKVFMDDVISVGNRSVPSTRAEAAAVEGVIDEIYAEHMDGSVSEATSVALPQGEGESALFSSEGTSLATSDPSDLEYTPSPGIYTLLLNADNTFSLVSEGYQGSATPAGSQVFVCRRCRKFAPSQVEILNHISLCHPQDLSNINQCVLELGALPPSYGATSSNDTLSNTNPQLASSVSLSVDTADQPLEDCWLVQGSDTAETRSAGQQDIKSETNKRTVKRKLGRPRKEATVSGQESQPEVRKRFRMVGEGMVCLDCERFFLKQRQFDKHRCSAWQVCLLSPSQINPLHPAASSLSAEEEPAQVSSGSEYFGEDIHKPLQEPACEEDTDEEWKGSSNHKPRVSKPRGGERRKRGRPPKVDQLAAHAGCKESLARVGLQADDQVTRDRLRSGVRDDQVLTASQYPINSDLATASPTVPPRLHHIPTLPLFSNPRQQERLHKWIAQTDLSFVDGLIEKVQPDRGASEKREVTMFSCRECKLLFRTLISCRRHCAKHTTKKAFTCPDCDYATTSVGGLYSHYRNHTQNLYSCDKCDFKARIKAHYRDHLETHTPSRHTCRLCQRPYSTSSSLRSHIYLNHRNEEGMKYLWCLRKVNQEHHGGHTSVFQCPVCQKLFNELTLVNSHLASHGYSVPQEVLRCEVCGMEPLHQGTLKKHLQKHKVVYICCVCYEPQVTASCLQSHLKDGACGSSREDTFKLSLLYSYTSPDTLPSLISNKIHGIGSLLQDLQKQHNYLHLPSTRARSRLIQQVLGAGYKQLSELLQQRLGESYLKTERKVMKIVVNTRCMAKGKQHDKLQMPPGPQEQEIACQDPLTKEVQEQENHRQSPPPQDSPRQDTHDRVVVISNTGEEEQSVVVEEEGMVEEENQFVIIHEDVVEHQPAKLVHLLAQVD